jgi:hypothetical protein
MRRSNLLLPGLVSVLVTAGVGPRRWRAPARAATAVYLLTISGVGVAVAARADHKREAALVPVVLATMHVGFGLGFLHGVVRYGPPLGGLASALGARGLARRLSSPSRPVFAPSLDG